MIKADLWIPNIRGDLTLHEAVHSGRKDLVRWLLSQKSQNMVNVANNDGKCPLHIAAINNNVEMCKVFFLSIIFKFFWLFSLIQYLVHRIQQPISKLRILIFTNVFSNFFLKNNMIVWRIRENSYFLIRNLSWIR